MLDNLILYLWILIQVLIGYNLILPIIFFIFYKVFYNQKNNQVNFSTRNELDYAIIVTAYEQTDLVPAAVKSILNLNYSNFLIYVVADNCDISELIFNDERVILLRPEKTIASNTGSHFYAIKHFKRNHTHLSIIDSDNLVDPEYLNELNSYFHKGFHAVQGLRKAKNLDTKLAALDAARDLYYHYFDGKLLFNIGSSATLSGSGMAFTVKLFRDCLEGKEIKGAGFDKVLQYAILERNLRIAFAEKAIVYDEKSSFSDQLVKQRSRWINTWFKYFGNGFKLLKKSIHNASINQFLFGIVLIRPPLFIFLILSIACLIINIWIDPIMVMVWLIAFLFFTIAFCISIFQKGTNHRIYKSLLNVPVFMLLQVISLLKIKSANKISVATKHHHKKTLED